MTKTRTIILTGLAVFLLGAMASPARAGYVFTIAPNAVNCSLNGATGNSGTDELCFFAADGGNDWGSPGVDLGTTVYDGVQAAYGLEIDFGTGVIVDAAAVTTGNNAACKGSSGGGTTFCTESPTAPWVATIIDNGNGIEFLASSPAFDLIQGQSYFVNVFLDTAASTAIANGFTGQWFTQFQGASSAPEPASLALIFSGIAGLYFGSRWSRKLNRNSRSESDR